MTGNEKFVAMLKFKVQAEWSSRWIELVSEITTLTKAEPGCLWFEWTRSVDNPNHFVLVEGFESEEAHQVHEAAEYVQRALPDLLAKLTEPIPRFVVASASNFDGWLHANVAPPVTSAQQ